MELELPKLNLSGSRIWLSGAIPEPDGETPDIQATLEAWLGSDLESGILGFVQEFASLVMAYGGRIIHGSHPSFSPILMECARNHIATEEKPLELCASRFFIEPDDADWQRWGSCAKMTVTESTGTGDKERDPSLAVLRNYMADHCTAFIAIGGRWWSEVPGRAGVPKEFEQAKKRGVPCFVLGGFGGVSQTYVRKNPDWLTGLNNGLSKEANKSLSETTNFALAAGKIASQIHKLQDADGQAGSTGIAGI